MAVILSRAEIYQASEIRLTLLGVDQVECKHREVQLDFGREIVNIAGL